MACFGHYGSYAMQKSDHIGAMFYLYAVLMRSIRSHTISILLSSRLKSVCLLDIIQRSHA